MIKTLVKIAALTQSALACYDYATPATDFDNVLKLRDVPYGRAFNVMTGEDQQLLLDVYLPSPFDKDLKRPAVVWVHGGGFTSGVKDEDETAIR